MNTETFWAMIASARDQSAGNIERQHGSLIDTWSQLDELDIQEFDHILWKMMARAYRADLWEAAFLVACHCGEDSFEYFRGWLIAQGQYIYERVLADSEYLANFVNKEQRGNIFDEQMTYIAVDAYKQKTGRQMPEQGYQEKVILVGGPLTPEDDLPTKFPRIVAKLGICDDEIFG